MSFKKSSVFLAVIAAVSTGLVACSSFFSSKPKHPHVLFIVLDTTRADHLSAYGYERETSPNLDAFARENVIFRYAVTASPWTPPSVATMMTGLYPVSHGVMPPNSREKARKQFHRLSDKLETAAEHFKKNGYRTGGITPNPWCSQEFNYNQGFDDYQFLSREPAGRITKEGIALIDKFLPSGDPMFIYLHYLDPHDPYNPPEQYRMFKGNLSSRTYDPATQEDINLYDGEIRYMDASLGKLFAHLREKGIYEDMKIVIVGDHGEQFRERGDMGHGFKLHNEELHVPLLMRSGDTRDVDFTVSTVDVYPTLLDLAGLPIPEDAQGVSLVKNENSRERNGVFSEIRRKFNQRGFTTFEGKKIILNYDDLEYPGAEVDKASGVGLFDRHVDYREQKSIDDPAAVQTLLKDLDAVYKKITRIEGVSEESKIDINEDTVKQLKSLGYLQ